MLDLDKRSSLFWFDINIFKKLYEIDTKSLREVELYGWLCQGKKTGDHRPNLSGACKRKCQCWSNIWCHKIQQNDIQQSDIQENDIQQNDIQHNDIQHNGIWQNDIQQNDIQRNDIQYNDIWHNDIQQNDIQHKDEQLKSAIWQSLQWWHFAV